MSHDAELKKERALSDLLFAALRHWHGGAREFTVDHEQCAICDAQQAYMDARGITAAPATILGSRTYAQERPSNLMLSAVFTGEARQSRTE